MPTESDQTRLARLDERLTHLMGAVDDIKIGMQALATKEQLAEMVTRSDHATVYGDLRNRIEKLEAQTPMSMIDIITRVAVAVSAVGAAVALLLGVAKH